MTTPSLLISEKKKPVSDFVKLGFEAVLEAFLENFEEGKEVGAACCVYYSGEKVVDLWGVLTPTLVILPARLSHAGN